MKEHLICFPTVHVPWTSLKFSKHPEVFFFHSSSIFQNKHFPNRSFYHLVWTKEVWKTPSNIIQLHFVVIWHYTEDVNVFEKVIPKRICFGWVMESQFPLSPGLISQWRYYYERCIHYLSKYSKGHTSRKYNGYHGDRLICCFVVFSPELLAGEL